MFKKKQDHRKDNFMLYVPRRKHQTWKEEAGKVVLIFHHNHPVQVVAFWLIRKSRVTDMTLDELGSAVWLAIDGKSNVYEIGQNIKKQFGDGAEPLYERLTLFLRYLVRRGWIMFDNPQAQK